MGAHMKWRWPWSRKAASRAYFAGARLTRLEADWWTTQCSIDQEIKSDALKLKERARDLVRNWPYARRFVQLVAANVVGPDGITLQPQVKSRNDEYDERVNAALLDAWTRWGRAETCTVDGRLSWLDVQRLWAQSEPTDGEFLLRMVSGFDNDFGFALQVIDPDQLDLKYSRTPGTDQNEIRMGVEIDRWGRRVAFHFLTAHPSEAYRTGQPERIRVPADEVVHLFHVTRPQQTRGLTWFHSVLLASRMLDGYLEAELVAARIAAATGGFIQPDKELGGEAQTPGPEETIDMQAGSFYRLAPGETMQTFNPEHPTGAFADFHKAVLRQIAAGLGVAYASLANDLSDANYSSMRSGKLAEQDEWKVLQRRLIEQFCERVYRAWLPQALASGQLRLPVDVDRYLAVRFQPRTWPWVDPSVDIDSAHAEVQLGINSRTRIAASQGRNLREVFAELDKENQLAAEFGLTLGADTHIESFGDVNATPADGATAAPQIMKGAA